MAEIGRCFVEWKEEFVSKERGNRVVHYFLKDVSGESILAVVGTERSVRHMFYVVSEEFLNVCGSDNSIQAGYRWRSRREVVNWLTSMLSKQHQQGLTKHDPAMGVGGQQTHIPDYRDRVARSLKGHASDIAWSGVAWTCGKQLRHYPAFCRTGTKIGIHSFVFVMAEKDNRYLAYLEDMYEDRKGQKKVKVRWFHKNQEVKSAISLRNPHPKEVFITPYAQIISAECIDGLSIVLSREHYEKCSTVLPHVLLARAHFCCRQFRGNRVKPFKLSKLRGYFDQPIFSCFNPEFFEDGEDNVKQEAKGTRNCRGSDMLPCEPSFQKYGLLRRRVLSSKHIDGQPWHSALFKVNEKIELLCQDSGIRGCWFRCTVLEISRKQMKVLYDDVKDEDGCGNLEEWIPSYRLAMPDKFGIRCSGRPTIRPARPSHDQTDLSLEIGAPVDAWWSDGWWEGVVTEASNSNNESLQVCIPSENLFLNIPRKNLRVSKDWVGNQWVDIKAKSDVVSLISATISSGNKFSVSPIANEVKSGGLNVSCPDIPSNGELKNVEDGKLNLQALAPSGDPSEQLKTVNEEKQPLTDNIDSENHKDGNENYGQSSDGDDTDNYDDNDDEEDDDMGDEENDKDKLGVEESKTVGEKSEAEPMEVEVEE